jgi:hypothetical protein
VSSSAKLRLFRWVCWLALPVTGGCLARLERNLDLVLAPDAFENALVLPFSRLLPVAQFLRLVL